MPRQVPESWRVAQYVIVEGGKEAGGRDREENEKRIIAGVCQL